MKVQLNDYEIIFSENRLESFRNEVKKIYHKDRIFCITDSNVYKIYAEKFEKIFYDFKVTFIIVDNKSFESYQQIINELLELKIVNTDLLIAFGGGTIGDVTGLVAATLFRGINYVQIPTTLLAQVDSSVGGKTAIDTKYGKNLVGAFYNPKLVLIDTLFLSSLDEREYNNGFAEVLKMTLLFDENMYHEIKSKDVLELNDIYKIVNYKKDIVIKDPYDKKERRYLNFGHTFGHAIEKTNDYKTFKHGEAISHGMLIALKIGQKLDITKDASIYDDLKNILINKKLISYEIDSLNEYYDDIIFDKKHDEKGLNFIVLEKIGKPKTIILKMEEL